MSQHLPPIFIAPNARKHLKRVVSNAYLSKERTAPFLDAELRRAQWCEPLPSDVVAPGSRVRYRLESGPASPERELVYPDAFHSDALQISLLSPIGIALLGKRCGDRMPVFIPDTGFQTLHVVAVA